jgi:hypothetical protein
MQAFEGHRIEEAARNGSSTNEGPEKCLRGNFMRKASERWGMACFVREEAMTVASRVSNIASRVASNGRFRWSKRAIRRSRKWHAL